MFGPLGVPEMLFILVLALLVFGPKRLPEIGRTLGKGMSEFRKASTELKRTINTELALEEEDLPSTAATRRLGIPSPVEPTATPIIPQGPPPEAQPRSPEAPSPAVSAEAAPEEPQNQPVEPQ